VLTNTKPGPKPYLDILVQPLEGPYRFRYKSELEKDNHGCLMGPKTSSGRKTFPTVALRNFNFAAKAIIGCSLYQVADEQNTSVPLKIPHCHSIFQRNQDDSTDSFIRTKVSRENNFTAM
jgi:hypothetical protein